jgi:RNA polymerase subunit RPABC4/transcription elongation factor Spt4
MDCGRCGSWLDSPRESGLFYMDEDIVCPDCGTTNQVGVDDNGNYNGDDEESAGTAYVSHWICKHGTDEDTPCPECDEEDERERRWYMRLYRKVMNWIWLRLA